MATALYSLYAAGALGCKKEGGPTAPPTDRVRVLFIGNSLTSANDLPGILDALADSAGVKPLEVVNISMDNTALSDHYLFLSARSVIQQGGWNYVVLQQGPSSRPANRDSLRMFAERFATDIRRVGARPALYMVWPAAENAADYDRAVESYTLAADDVDGLLFPGGELLRAALARDATLPLLSSDGYHPSPMGSYLVALSMFGILYDRSPVGLPPRVVTRQNVSVTISTPTATLLQEVAADGNERFGRR
ncbi:MAG TPA: SGNH/GDSL hydrolase family protein [Gemmatimonadaceae bacterium]|nr:SGNH/GDSL hydrolase family protein [Gemmatimonadaceae bacterium]